MLTESLQIVIRVEKRMGPYGEMLTQCVGRVKACDREEQYEDLRTEFSSRVNIRSYLVSQRIYAENRLDQYTNSPKWSPGISSE